MLLHIPEALVEKLIRDARAAGMHNAANRILEAARRGPCIVVDVENEHIPSVEQLARVVGGEAGELIMNQVQAVKTEDW